VDDGEVWQAVYTIAADYNFGQISAEWVRMIVKQNGGEMVGEEFIPLVSRSSRKPSRIFRRSNRRADYAIGRHARRPITSKPLPPTSRFRWAVRSMSPGYEHKRFKPPSLANMYATVNYVEEVDTRKARRS